MINIAVIGTGVVGKAFISQLDSLIQRHGVKQTLNVVLISRSSTALVSTNYAPLNLQSWETDLKNKGQAALSISELVRFLKASPNPAIVVDNTSNQTLAEAYPTLLDNSISVVTPNKKAFSDTIELWQAIFQAASKPGAGLVYHEASVGAGLPIIGTLKDLVATGDKIKKIEGIFSGSLSFCLNQFSKLGGSTVKFSDIVLQARDLGYTEPDPRDDLNGLDVARKVTILSRLAGYEVASPTAFPVDSLIPKPLESVESVADFVAQLPDYDHEIDQLRKEAEAANQVLRFVGKVDLSGPTKSVSVGLQRYDASHPFASLTGSDNVIAFETERYPKPLIVQGAGAGAEVTASGVLADLLRVCERL